MLVLKTVIYKSKLLDFQNFTSLVLDIFKKTLEKKVVFLVTLTIMADFAKLMEYLGLNTDLLYFNAQHSRNFGYEKWILKNKLKYLIVHWRPCKSDLA